MPAKPFRFIHAANLRLGQTVMAGDRWEGSHGSLAAQAPAIAFRRVIELCLEHEVDFLILSGNSFDASTGVSSDVQTELEAGLQTLSEHGIHSFIMPGERDPSEIWKSEIPLPTQATLLDPDACESIVVTRNGRDICALSPVVLADSKQSLVLSTEPSALFHLGIVTATDSGISGAETSVVAGRSLSSTVLREIFDQGIDYLALQPGQHRQTYKDSRGIAHDPGPPQAIRTEETGPHGCTLVEVDGQGEVALRLLPTSVIRCERMLVDLSVVKHRQELVETMSLELMDRDPCAGEELWLVEWIFDGGLSDSLSIDGEQDQLQLAEEIEAELGSEGPLRLHSFVVSVPSTDSSSDSKQPARGSFGGPSGRHHLSDRVAIPFSSEQDTLRMEFDDVITRQGSADLLQLKREVQHAEWKETDWGRAVADCLDRWDDETVLAAARTVGDQWLSG